MADKEYKAVYFDLDDTLYSRAVPFKEACEDFFGSPAFDPIKAHELFRHRGDEVFLPSRRGEITMEEMYIYRFSKAMEDLGIAVSDEEALRFQSLYKSRQNRIHLDEQVKRILTFVKEKQLSLGVITNGPADHQMEKYKALGLDAYMPPERIFISGAYGSNKPETLMFTEAQKAAGLGSADFLYVGDSFESDVQGAAAAGWDVLWLDLKKEYTEKVRQDISEKGVSLYAAENLDELYSRLEELLTTWRRYTSLVERKQHEEDICNQRSVS